MIFQLLVVDDEATMRKGIANYMNWASIDCEVAGTASDGAEAIDFLSEHSVDIVITDIKMPVADGLEVARYVYEHKPDTKVILLTGYADFSYAQTAIKYNVSSFILKPTNKKSLFEAVQEAQKSIISSRKSSNMAKEGTAFLKDQLLQDLTVSPLSAELRRQMNVLGLDLSHYFIAAFQASEGPEDILTLKDIIIHEEVNAYCYRYNNLIITLYFTETPSEKVPERILSNCREISELAAAVSSLDVIVGISCGHSGPEEFGSAVSEAIHALTLNFYTEGNIALFMDTINASRFDLTAEHSMYLFQFESALNHMAFEEASNLLSGIFMKFRSNFVNSADVKNICSQIYYICSRVLMQRQLSAPDPAFLHQILSSSDIFSLEETSTALMQNVKELLLQSLGSQNRMIESAKNYILEHLTAPLSLEIIADYLHISPSHLSRTFKKECGEALTEYINLVRIEKAKELLHNSSILNYEVAEAIGYHDAAYFSSIFKKYTGVSPSEYRQGNRCGSDNGSELQRGTHPQGLQ